MGKEIIRDTREYLNQIQRYDKIIQNKQEEIDYLHSLATSLGSFSYGEKVQSSGSQDKMGDLVSKIVDLQVELIDIRQKYLDKRTEVIRSIDAVTNPVLYDILFKKYVKGKSLDVIADNIGYSYQRTKELHLQAIATVKKNENFDS